MTLDDLLGSHTPAVAAVFHDLRRLVHDALPGLEERVYPGWHALGFRDPDAGYLCGLFPFEDHVRLLFEHGARLRDPDGVLEGNDRKQVRWITVRPDSPAPRGAIIGLLGTAVHYGRMRSSRTVRARRRGGPYLAESTTLSHT